MDTIKTGKLIAELRRRQGITQEALGERLCVTNKTVSRWENGNYMPDIGTLGLLAKELGVSADELIAGELAPEEPQPQLLCGCGNAAQRAKSSPFTIEEQKAYYKTKWRKEHVSLFVLLGAVLAAVVALSILFVGLPFLGVAPLVALAEYGYQNNKMMAYVEEHIWG